MAFTLNDKIKNLTPYDPIEGEYKIRLDANESFIPVPSHIASRIFQDSSFISFNRYPDPYATDLCIAFSKYYQIDDSNVVAGNGSDELISIIIAAFLMKGDKVITLSPDFSMYSFYSFIAEADIININKNQDLTINVDQLIQTANENNAKMILFSNPCNPTSLGLTRKQVRKIIHSVNSLVVLDEAYMDFWDQSLLSEINEYDNLIILRTCSKAFGMAAIRLGFAVANKTLTKSIKSVKSPYNVNSVTQAIGTAVLKENKFLHNAIDDIVTSKNELYEAMKQIEYNYPNKIHVFESYTNFLLIKVEQADYVYKFLLENSIAVRLMGNYLRITAGTKEENDELVKRLNESLMMVSKG